MTAKGDEDRLRIRLEIEAAVRCTEHRDVRSRTAAGIVGHAGMAGRAADICDLDAATAQRGEHAVGHAQRKCRRWHRNARRQVGDGTGREKAEAGQDLSKRGLVDRRCRIAAAFVEYQSGCRQFPRDRRAFERFGRDPAEPRSNERRRALGLRGGAGSKCRLCGRRRLWPRGEPRQERQPCDDECKGTNDPPAMLDHVATVREGRTIGNCKARCRKRGNAEVVTPTGIEPVFSP